jgi:ABC-type multidrug transport system fused ATPase/permease subunit
LPIYIMLGWPVINISHLSEERLQEYEASNKSPLFAHLSTTLEGLFSIRLYNVQDRFDTYNRTLIDADHKALYSLLSVKAFMALYLDIIACLFIYLAALFVVLFNLNGATTGLALTNAMQLVLFVQWLVRMVGELHSSMNSVLLVTSFAKSIPREFRDKDPTKIKPPPQWPQRGEIDFKNVTLRYHQYGVAVLKSVSFHIYEGEKIAIVGRSGSGKTTLLMSLLRMTQPVEGDILIDDVDTNSVDLKTLRSKMAIIPQQPVLFSGTIRSNLDPFGHCTDGQIWEALKAVHLGEKIKEMPAQLDTTVTENGKTFSSAERQLFSIARAVLIQTKIVVIDGRFTLGI